MALCKTTTMKKLYFLSWFMAAVMAVAGSVFVTSCSDDEGDAPLRYGISVNTAALYNELGIADEIKKELAKGEITIVGSVLIYDETGKKVFSVDAEIASLSPLTFAPEGLADGKYTVVSFLAACSKEDGSFWRLKDAGQLSTVRVMAVDEGPYPFAAAVGSASASVTVSGGKFIANLSPKSVGSIVDVKIDNLTRESDYTLLTLMYAVDESHDGFYLDPARSGDDVWVVIDTPYKYHKLLCVIYPECTSGKFFTLTTGEQATLDLSCSNGEGGDYVDIKGKYNLSSGGKYVYYFDMNRLNCQPPFFGSSEDFDVWKADRDNGVLVADPYTKWGCSIAEVESYVQAKQWWLAGNQEYEYWNPYGWSKWYYVAHEGLIEYYMFETKEGQNLIYSSCRCSDPALPIEAAGTSLLKQGYVYSGKIKSPEDGLYDIYFSEDGATEVMVIPDSDGNWRIDYQPTDPDDLQYIIKEGTK
jgi:hypothetical protein